MCKYLYMVVLRIGGVLWSGLKSPKKSLLRKRQGVIIRPPVKETYKKEADYLAL